MLMMLQFVFKFPCPDDYRKTTWHANTMVLKSIDFVLFFDFSVNLNMCLDLSSSLYDAMRAKTLNQISPFGVTSKERNIHFVNVFNVAIADRSVKGIY